MSKFYLYHISFFDSLFNGLKSNGVDLDRIAQQSFIKRFDLNNPNTYIPHKVAYDFCTKIKRSQGIDCITSEFYSDFQFESLSDYGQFVTSFPDLGSILRNSIKYEAFIQTNSKATLRSEGPLTWLSVPHYDAPSEGRQISERINISMMLKAMQFVLGKDWLPLEIHLTSSNGNWLEKLIPSANFKLKCNCSEVAICFNTVELSRKNKLYSNDYSFDYKSTDSIESITSKVFNSMDTNYFPTLEEMSTYFSYSKRTLIREYAKTNTSYKEIMEKHRFQLAIQLLHGNSLSIKSISDKLGYSTSSNFIRAFKRWTGFTPEHYRN